MTSSFEKDTSLKPEGLGLGVKPPVWSVADQRTLDIPELSAPCTKRGKDKEP